MINPGSKGNKILGCRLDADRSKLKVHSINAKAGCTPVRVLHDNVSNYLLLNLAATPEMGANEFRLCLFFFHYVINEDSRTKIDNIYSLTSNDIKIRTIGENYSVYVLDTDTDETEEYKMPFISLQNRLRKANVNIPLKSLKPTLQNLHDFGYITITEITSNNAEIERDEPLLTDCILIKVNFTMMLASQNKRWVRIKETL